MRMELLRQAANYSTTAVIKYIEATGLEVQDDETGLEVQDDEFGPWGI